MDFQGYKTKQDAFLEGPPGMEDLAPQRSRPS